MCSTTTDTLARNVHGIAGLLEVGWVSILISMSFSGGKALIVSDRNHPVVASVTVTVPPSTSPACALTESWVAGVMKEKLDLG